MERTRHELNRRSMGNLWKYRIGEVVHLAAPPAQEQHPSNARWTNHVAHSVIPVRIQRRLRLQLGVEEREQPAMYSVYENRYLVVIRGGPW